MSPVRAGAALAAVGVHIAFLAFFVTFSRDAPTLAALESANGKDGLTIVATITLQSEESLGLDSESMRRQEASAGGAPSPQVEQAVRQEPEKIDLTPGKTEEPALPVEEKKPEKKVVEANPSSASLTSEEQEEQRAASRAFEARRNQELSLYNGKVYQALMKSALRPKTMQKGRVVLELTLGPSGELLSHRIVQSSGSAALDGIAMTSLERAAPFPPIPPEASREPHTLRVPFEYAVK